MYFGFRGMRFQQVDMSRAVDWSETIKWQQKMAIRGKTYMPPTLFPVSSTTHMDPDNITDERERVDSRTGKWRYSEVILPAKKTLETWNGSKIGIVAFDTDVAIPRINEKNMSGHFRMEPWMSMTPAEIISSRGGIRAATGTTVIAGLGMGYLLRKVAQKRSVKKIILVEICQELIDWIMPVIYPHLDKTIEVICDDAKKILPKMKKVDAFLVDIFEHYGSNTFPSCCAKTWTWGKSDV